MITTFVHEDGWHWDRWLDPLLLASWEVPQASTDNCKVNYVSQFDAYPMP